MKSRPLTKKQEAALRRSLRRRGKAWPAKIGDCVIVGDANAPGRVEHAVCRERDGRLVHIGPYDERIKARRRAMK